MTSTQFLPDILLAVCALFAVIVIAAAMLRGWQGWLSLKRRELDLLREPSAVATGSREGAARIELSDLKKRIRKLEAIANGVDL